MSAIRNLLRAAITTTKAEPRGVRTCDGCGRQTRDIPSLVGFAYCWDCRYGKKAA